MNISIANNAITTILGFQEEKESTDVINKIEYLTVSELSQSE